MVSVEIPETVWHKGIVAATAGWIVAVFGVGFLPTSLFGLVFFVSWILLPVSIYKDSQVTIESVKWPKRRWAYIIASLFWIIALVPGLLYLWRRRKLSRVEVDVNIEASVQGPDGEEFTVSMDDVDEVDETDLDHEYQFKEVEYEGAEYTCDNIAESDSGEWEAATGRSFTGVEQGTGNHRFFLLKEDEIQFTEELEKGQDTAIADTGTSAVIDALSSEDLSGKLIVFNKSGEQELSHFFNSNVGAVALSNDGEYVVVSTLNPECTTYIFEISGGQVIMEHENIEGNKRGLEFRNEEELHLYLSDSPGSDPFYAINTVGEVVWKSEEMERQQRLEDLMESSETVDLEEAIELLDEAYELATEKNEKKNVANKLADAHWTLAREIKKEEGDTDPWWSHLNQSKMYYTAVLPWYDGKQGVAKVSRKQGKYHLKQGNEETALELFQSIAELEEEYDVQLLTDADKEKLENLGS